MVAQTLDLPNANSKKTHEIVLGVKTHEITAFIRIHILYGSVIPILHDPWQNSINK